VRLVKENTSRSLTEEGAGEIPLGSTVALVLSISKFQLYFVEGVVGAYKTTVCEVHSGNVGAPCCLYVPAQPVNTGMFVPYNSHMFSHYNSQWSRLTSLILSQIYLVLVLSGESDWRKHSLM
jgi:hypothetical protein